MFDQSENSPPAVRLARAAVARGCSQESSKLLVAVTLLGVAQVAQAIAPQSCGAAASALVRYEGQVKDIHEWVTTRDIPRVCGQDTACNAWSGSALDSWGREQRIWIQRHREEINRSCRGAPSDDTVARVRKMLQSLHITVDIDSVLGGLQAQTVVYIHIPDVPAGIHHTWSSGHAGNAPPKH